MAPPSPQVARAFQAMKAIGLTEQQVKPVLKNLLKLYNRDWSLIEAEEYRALADAIFEAEDAKVAAQKKKCNNDNLEDIESKSLPHHEPEVRLTRLRSRSQDESSSQKKKSADDELEDNVEEEFLVPRRPLKRLRLQNQGDQVSPSSNTCNPMSGGTSLIKPRVEAEELLNTGSAKHPQNTSHSPESMPPVSPRSGIKDKGKQPVISKPLALQGKSVSERSSNDVCFKETVVEPGIVLLPNQCVNSSALIERKDEPFTGDMAQDEVPITMIHPDESDQPSPPLLMEGATGNQYDEPVASQERESRHDIPVSSNEGSMNNELATIPEGSHSNLGESPCLEVASSPSGEVKLSLSCSSAVRRPGFHIPNLDAILKLTEDKCLDTSKIIEPNLSLKNLLGHMCESFLELATNSNDKSQDGSINVASNLGSLQKSPAWDGVSGNKETVSMPPCALDGPVIFDCPRAVTDPEVPRIPFPLNGDSPQVSGTVVSNGFSEDNMEDSLSLVVVQNSDLTADDTRTTHDINDISRGEERVKISWVNEWSRDRPASFYISKSVVSKDADLKVCQSSIEDKNYCATCFGDCLSASRVLNDKHTIDGRAVEAKKALSGEEQQTSNRTGNFNATRSSGGGGNFKTKKIFVGGLPSTLTEDGFRQFFEEYGSVTDVVIMYDQNTQRPRGFGFITFDTEDAADRVLQKNFHEVNGKQVEVKRALPKDANPGGGGHGGGYQGYSASGAGSNAFEGRTDGNRYMQPQSTTAGGFPPYSGYGAAGYGYGGNTGVGYGGYGSYGVGGYGSANFGFGGPAGSYGNPNAPTGYVGGAPGALKNAWSSQSPSSYGASGGYGAAASWAAPGGSAPSAPRGQSPSAVSGYENQGYGYGNYGGRYGSYPGMYGASGGRGGEHQQWCRATRNARWLHG